MWRHSTAIPAVHFSAMSHNSLLNSWQLQAHIGCDIFNSLAYNAVMLYQQPTLPQILLLMYVLTSLRSNLSSLLPDLLCCLASMSIQKQTLLSRNSCALCKSLNKPFPNIDHCRSDIKYSLLSAEVLTEIKLISCILWILLAL